MFNVGTKVMIFPDTSKYFNEKVTETYKLVEHGHTADQKTYSLTPTEALMYQSFR